MPKTVIHTSQIAPPVGPFSPAASAGDLVCLSGQVAQDPATGKLIEGDISAQAERVLQNLEAVLRAAGKTWEDVLRVGIYLTSMGDFAAVNAVYQRFLKPPFPARTTVAVAALPLGAAVEMDLIAA